MSLKSLSQINLGQYTLPTSDGSNGQVLQTNGNGTVTFADNPNKFLSGLSFNTSTGVLTATVSGGSNVTVDLDNRYLELGGGILTGDLYLALSGSNQRALSSTGTNSMQIGDAGTQLLRFKNAAGIALDILANGNTTFKGKINAKGGANITGFHAGTINAYSATVSSNLYSALRIVDNTAASTYWDIGAVGGASPDLKFFVNAVTTPKLTLSATGNATFAGDVTVNGSH